jgi:hypothetical protein
VTKTLEGDQGPTWAVVPQEKEEEEEVTRTERRRHLSYEHQQ